MLRTFTANRYHPPEVLSLSLSDDPNGDSDGVLVTSTVGGATAALTGTNLGGDLLASRVTWNGVPVPGVRKSGMPDAVDMPAPVNTRIRLYFPDMICCTNVSRLNDSLLANLLLLLLNDRLTPDLIDEELPPAEVLVLKDLHIKNEIYI